MKQGPQREAAFSFDYLRPSFIAMRLWIGLRLPRLPLEVFSPSWCTDAGSVVLEQERVLALSGAARAAGVQPRMRRGGVLMLMPEALYAVAMAMPQFGGVRALCRRVLLEGYGQPAYGHPALRVYGAAGSRVAAAVGARRSVIMATEMSTPPMRYSRRTRFVAALAALFGLLFMQLATAAYACPKLSPVQQQSAMLDASGQPMKDCAELDKQSPSLCQADNHRAPQSADTASPPSIQPFVPTGLIVHVVTADELIPLGFTIPAAFLHASSTAPPIAIRNCCFRL
jgi:hypothetical protein